MAIDKKTIGVSKTNAAKLAQLEETGHFASELDAAKFAMAYAIRQGVRAGSAEHADTKWNVGSVDPDGSIRSLLEALYPDTRESYRLMEHLINEGLMLLGTGGIPDAYEALFPAARSSGRRT